MQDLFTSFKDNCGFGLLASIDNTPSHKNLEDAITSLSRMMHRGAIAADGKTGDGAGILIDIPHDFFTANCSFKLPSAGNYAVSNVFLPKKKNQQTFCITVFEKHFKEQGLEILGWRNVPVDTSVLGKLAAKHNLLLNRFLLEKQTLNRMISNLT